MKAIRYIVGVIGFILVWFVVAVVVAFIINQMFPVPRDASGNIQAVRIGIGLGWRNLPGTILGLMAGIQSFRASVGASRKPKDQT